MSARSLTRAEVREVDRRAISDYSMIGLVLMENAGRGAVELLLRLKVRGSVVVCAGKGNNAGDGFVMARHLENQGVGVEVFLFSDPAELSADAAANFRVIHAAKTPIRLVPADDSLDEFAIACQRSDWVIDALLGTGTQGDIREPYASVISRINASGSKVLAVDLPSGLDCDTGTVLGCCVVANNTATFVARKRGFDNADSTANTGDVHVIDIGVPKIMLDR